jgi:hypothetical protein
LQYLQQDDVHYYVSGNAAKYDGKCNPIQQTRWCELQHGYSFHHLNQTHLVTQYNNMLGDRLQVFVQQRRRK